VPDETNGVNNAASCYPVIKKQYIASFVTSLVAVFDKICRRQ